ncbi:MAG: DALR domain-containing protein, partial [Candidatus Angelobacter sp.]
LDQATHSVGRLRDFKSRIEMAHPGPGKNEKMQQLAEDARREMRAGLEDDLNTARALAAIFDMVREANTAADHDELKQDDKAPLLAALDQFDEIFAVIQDDDAEKMARASAWAKAHGLLEDSKLPANVIADEEVERLIAQRTAAKKARDFALSDGIRAKLSEAGIAVEDTKDGIRWKRK